MSYFRYNNELKPGVRVMTKAMMRSNPSRSNNVTVKLAIFLSPPDFDAGMGFNIKPLEVMDGLGLVFGK